MFAINAIFNGKHANLFKKSLGYGCPVKIKKPVFDTRFVKNRPSVILSSKPESLDQRPVPVDVFFLDVIQKASASSNKNQQPPS